MGKGLQYDPHAGPTEERFWIGDRDSGEPVRIIGPVTQDHDAFLRSIGRLSVELATVLFAVDDEEPTD